MIGCYGGGRYADDFDDDLDGRVDDGCCDFAGFVCNYHSLLRLIDQIRVICNR